MIQCGHCSLGGKPQGWGHDRLMGDHVSTDGCLVGDGREGPARRVDTVTVHSGMGCRGQLTRPFRSHLSCGVTGAVG